ncbi:Uncharacterized protein TCM_032436 [Theobroma cacao]|uniref:Uncharacterized protein n=1 Tax=Theobroma cacao TaxID=3641 RepID=A0A061FA73_THECC|nr:Uncharacterized protein TCM_032436 [Theobroma cacao]
MLDDSTSSRDNKGTVEVERTSSRGKKFSIRGRDKVGDGSGEVPSITIGISDVESIYSNKESSDLVSGNDISNEDVDWIRNQDNNESDKEGQEIDKSFKGIPYASNKNGKIVLVENMLFTSVQHFRELENGDLWSWFFNLVYTAIRDFNKPLAVMSDGQTPACGKGTLEELGRGARFVFAHGDAKRPSFPKLTTPVTSTAPTTSTTSTLVMNSDGPRGTQTSASHVVDM